VEEIIILHGLEVQRRKVAYGNINSREATAIFIRSALVEENLMPSRNRNASKRLRRRRSHAPEHFRRSTNSDHLPLFTLSIHAPMNWPIWCLPVFWSASRMTG
jgi:hypothetical protein